MLGCCDSEASCPNGHVPLARRPSHRRLARIHHRTAILSPAGPPARAAGPSNGKASRGPFLANGAPGGQPAGQPGRGVPLGGVRAKRLGRGQPSTQECSKGKLRGAKGVRAVQGVFTRDMQQACSSCSCCSSCGRSMWRAAKTTPRSFWGGRPGWQNLRSGPIFQESQYFCDTGRWCAARRGPAPRLRAPAAHRISVMDGEDSDGTQDDCRMAAQGGRAQNGTSASAQRPAKRRFPVGEGEGGRCAARTRRLRTLPPRAVRGAGEGRRCMRRVPPKRQCAC